MWNARRRGATYSHIAREHGISIERVRQIVNYETKWFVSYSDPGFLYAAERQRLGIRTPE